MPGLLGLGITAALGNIMFKTIFNRRLGTMFGAGDVEINAKDVMYVMIDGFMGYYQEKAEEITKLKEQVEVLKEELEQKKTQYDELSAEVSKGHEIADQWKSKYMRMVANAKHKK